MSKALFKGLFLVFFSVFGINPAFSSCEDEAGPAVNWANCDFTGIDLKNKDLSNAVLTSAIFDNADFSGAILENADLNRLKIATEFQFKLINKYLPDVKQVELEAKLAAKLA